MGTIVTLTRTKKVAGERVIGNLFQGTWHANRTASHLHDRFTLYISNLVAAIDVRQDMTAGNTHF